MRILLVSPKVTGIGGISRHVSALVERLRRKGLEVEVVSAENTPHIPVKGLYNPSFALTSAVKTLLLRVKRGGFDIVHGHNLPVWFSVKSAPARVEVLTLHGIYSESIRILYGGLAGDIATKLESWMLKRVDAVTCVSPRVCEYYQKIGVKTYYIPNGLDLEKLPREGVRLYERQVVYAGRLSYEKGFDILLEAVRLVDPSIHIVVLGSGLKELEERARRLSKELPNFHYLGFKEHFETLKIIAGSDALVLPSRAEGLPTVILEAMALKVPVIASRIPEITSAFGEPLAVLVEPENPVKLAEAVNNTLMNPPRHMIDRAREKVEREFNWDVITEKYVQLYAEILR
jgi:glycosyltransferase involved in cell wall biosynthesis